MPKLWTDTVEEHRRAVRDAALDAAAKLVAAHGLASVTMSKIAAETGIGRATLYKYFPDVESVLIAWHERQVGAHLEELARVRDQAGGPGQRLEAVLQAYALMIRDRPHGTDLPALLHRGGHIGRAHQQLTRLRRKTCWARPPAAETSATTSRLPNWLPTACTRSPPPAPCGPRPRSAGSSPSP